MSLDPPHSVSVSPPARTPGRRRTGALTLLVILLCATRTFGGTDEIDVTVKTVAEDVVQGKLISLSLPDGLLLRTHPGKTQHIALKELVRISTNQPIRSRARRGFTLYLANDDVLHGEITGGQDDAVVIESSDLGRVSVPLETVSRIDAARAAQPGFREAVEWLDRIHARDEDLILLTNSDILRGFITAIDANGVTIEGTLGEARVRHRLLVAARLASPVASAPTKPHVIVTLRSSGRLTMTEFDWSKNLIEGRLPNGQQVQIEAERVVTIDIVGGRWEWLSSHHPISYQHTPMLALGWDYRVDLNVLGDPIKVAGETFEHGIGVHSRSSLTYDLKGAYTEFVTWFGIDDNSGTHADVTLLILTDGKRRFEKAHVRRGTLFGPVRLDVRRAKRIELIVDFGDNGDLQDRLNWVEPALIR